MAQFKFLSTARVKANEMIDDTRTYISRLYNRSNELFTTASPFAQILEVVNNITKMLFFYIEDATVEQNILTAQRPESIYGLSRIAGHDAFRGSSATGEIKFRLNVNNDIDFSGDAIKIPANTIIRSDNNNLTYILKTNNDEFKINKSNSNYIYVPIVQGKLEQQTVTSTGEKLQSYNIITKGMTDHHDVKITVNSQLWTKYDSLYDMQPNTKGYLIKTGITGGLDIYFGNGSFGAIPITGATINIQYLITDGTKGNLTGSKDLTFKFETEGSDSLQNLYDLNELLEASFTVAPKLGVDAEDINLTKLIAPLQSHSFVLATPDNYEHFLSKYNMFSYLDAYNTTADGYLDDDNIIYIFMLPDVKRKIANDRDYFNLNLNEFTFSENEQNDVLKLIEDSGQQMVTTEVKIVEPKIKYFKMDIKIRYFEGYEKINLYNLIRSKISDYLINITRRDRLPASDIIALLEDIEGIDSVNVKFSSKAEEDARRLGYYTLEKITVTPSTPTLKDIGNGKQKFLFFKRNVNIQRVDIKPNESLPENVINLDSFGDILLNKEEIALFRGNWKDRDNIEITDDVLMGENAAVSIYFDEPAIKNTIFTQIQAKNRRKI